jgi:hypothetical protein
MFDMHGQALPGVGKRREAPARAPASGFKKQGPGASSSPPSPGCPIEGSLLMPAFLARRYDECVQVDHRDNEPVAFVRRHRGYVVRSVLAHWWETGPWWQTAEVTEGLSDDEREMWRVEAAAAGRAVVVVELCHSWSTGRWTVAAVCD